MRKRYLLDTQPLLYLATTKEIRKVGKKAMRVIEDANSELLVNSISVTEIVIKKQSRRHQYFAMELSTVHKLIERLDITLIDYTTEHANKLEQVPLLPNHQEPFDRMIIATALVLDIPLIGGDRAFQQYAGLKVIWR